ncbi:MAG: tRNA (N(6)-L-threonylcarbamoyladenosine(37)-C(2))-methylthiotransferase [Candidatus Thorarchaeota archaeon]
MRFYLETYGCSLNSSDSDVMEHILTTLGATKVSSPDDADLILVNTCGVKEPTEDKILSQLSRLGQLGPPVIVAGCLTRISPARVRQAIPSFAALVPPDAIGLIEEVVGRVLTGERNLTEFAGTPSPKLEHIGYQGSSVICTVPLCEGCLGECTYCAVRLARGRVRSNSIDEICRAVERCICHGCREIRLTAQDVGAFGHDTGESLIDLLSRIDMIRGAHVCRLGMFNVHLVQDFLPDLLEVVRSPHFFRFFHVPLQSGSDRLLELMGRPYTVAEWEWAVSTIRSTFPDATIATDVIVGFPDESEQDFDMTYDLIRRVRPDVVNISKYGDRPGTVASRADHKVPTDTKKSRSRKLTRLALSISEASNQALVGWCGPVIITERGADSSSLGRTWSYRRIVLREDISPGTVVNCRVVSASKTHLLGRLIQPGERP